MRRYFIIILTAVLTVNCANQKAGSQKRAFIEGTYVFKKKAVEGTIGKLLLTQNRQFEYSYREGLAEYRTNGYYVIENNALILNSDTDFISKNGNVKELYTQGNNKTVLKFVNPSNIPVKGLDVLLDGILFKTDSVGEVNTTNTFKSIFSKFYTDFCFYYWKVNGTSNFLMVQLLPNSNSEIYFIESKFKIRRRSLLDEEGRVYVKEK